MFTSASGKCGLPGSGRLPPQNGRPIVYDVGPFTAKLAPTLWVKQAAIVPSPLFVGLLTRLPNPDGDFHEEFVGEGYQRQQVDVGAYQSRLDAVTSHNSFELQPGGEAVQSVGLFDDGGRLAYYGRLHGVRQSSTPPRQFTFRPYDLRLAWLATPSAPRRQ